MLYNYKIDVSKGNDPPQSYNSKESLVYHYWFFILIDEKNYKDLVIYFTSSVHYKPVKVLGSPYFELIREI